LDYFGRRLIVQGVADEIAVCLLQLIGRDVKLTVAIINIARIIVVHELVIGRWVRITVNIGDLLQMAIELLRIDALS